VDGCSNWFVCCCQKPFIFTCLNLHVHRSMRFDGTDEISNNDPTRMDDANQMAPGQNFRSRRITHFRPERHPAGAYRLVSDFQAVLETMFKKRGSRRLRARWLSRDY